MASLSIRFKVLASLVVVASFFGFGMILFAKTIIYHKLHDKLMDKGVVLTRRIAADCVNPVITERYFEIVMYFKDLMASENDIVYAYVVNEDGNDIARTFAHPVPQALKLAHQADLKQSFSSKRLNTDKGSVQDIAVPLLQGKIGVLHIGFSEGAIEKDVNDIVMSVVLFSVGVLLLGITASLVFSRAITRPLLMLANAAEAFGRGEMRTRVVIASDDEVGELARIFNSMVDKRRQAEAEREKLIRHLQEALAEVKLLSGFLPICMSCKKIRDDKGYWNQIESYISTHSDVKFSHSVCPECAKKLYPDIVDENGNV
ncbi:MAG: HAMP domain-containing protein [Desulfobacteraceae bacterium]|jgi:two-component system, cell cycle sensor histidine kinase and response regulator CckA